VALGWPLAKREVDPLYSGPMLSYLDASTGSMLMAAVAGGAAGIAVLVRMYWHRAMGVFSKKHKTQAEESFHELMGETPTE
jgi:hypothetical protein